MPLEHSAGKGCGNMAKLVPKEKMSKKARRALTAEKRAVWAFSPVTRKIDSKKIYNRKRITRAGYDDGSGVFMRFRALPASALPFAALSVRHQLSQAAFGVDQNGMGAELQYRRVAAAVAIRGADGVFG